MVTARRLRGVSHHAEIGYLRRTWDPARCCVLDGSVRFLESILHQQMQVVPLVEDLALDAGIELSQPANLSVLLRDELLTHGRDLDVHVIFGKVEVRPEEPGWLAVGVPIDCKRLRFVCPLDLVKIQESREFPLAVVREIGGLRL
jgi:hypothetical protein